MKSLLYPVFTTLLFSICFTSTAQKKVYPNTLLWRITGNGLTKPSYLYGTMHFNDRRLFHFSDSLYSYLEKAEAFAMEVDADEMLKALILSFSAEDTTGYLKDAINKEDYQNVAAELETQFGIPASKITKKQAWIYKQSIQTKTKAKADDMDSFVDAYLYNIAKRQGKWVGGIEDMKDQLDLIQDFDGGFYLNNKYFQKKENQLKEKLIKLYIAQDLNSLREWFDEMEPNERYKLLTKRNFKMADRIDSMSALKSCFFAVGAGHLPGDDGLINLLLSKGFNVDPVTSKNKIAPEKYTYKAVDLPWLKVINEAKAYTAFMPGEAVPFQPVESPFKMYMYNDLGTGLSYLIASIQSSAGNKEEMVKRFEDYFYPNQKNSSAKSIAYKGFKSRELYRFDKGYYVRMLVVPAGNNIVLAMVGSQKKNLLNEKEAQKFYQMLQVHEVENDIEEEASTVFTDKEKSFEITFPGKSFVNKDVQKSMAQQEGSEDWNYNNQTYTSGAGDLYFSVLYKETKPGFFIVSDKELFDGSISFYKNHQNFTVTRLDSGLWNGDPAIWLDGEMNKSDISFKTFHVNRGNRSYSLTAVFEKKDNTPRVTDFFNSFKLKNFETLDWRNYSAPGGSFQTMAPAAFTITDQEVNTDNSTRYLSQDLKNGLSFQVYAEPISKYYWTENDSTLYADLLSLYKTADDTLVYSNKIINGIAGGMEYRVLMGEERRNMKRLQMFTHNDSTYTLILIAPEQYATSNTFDPFFKEFRFIDFIKATKHLQDKTATILNNLLSNDSTVFEEAQVALEDVNFESKHLPLLHQALLEPYADFDENTYCTHDIIINKISSLKDASTISFVENYYASLSGENEKLKFPFLRLLANIKTDQSYKLLQNLLIHQTPKAGKSSGLVNALSDSLSLTATIFAGLLKVADNKEVADVIAIIGNYLIDSNYITIKDLQSHKNILLKHAENKIATSVVNTDWILYNWILFLGKFNDTESNNLLEQVLKSDVLENVYDAAVVLLKNNQRVDPKIIMKLADDKSYRLPLYLELEKLKGLKLFPSKYLNQKSIAESELYSIAVDYDNVENVMYLGERTRIANGEKQKYYLFKVVFNGENELEEYLGITGPYNFNSKKIETSSKAAGFAQGLYNTKTIDSQFKQYLLTLEEE